MSTSRVFPPPVFDHPLKEGDKRHSSPSQAPPLSEGVPEGRGRFSGEAPEPLPLHRKHYNSHLQPLANELRHHMTKAEACLWKYVLRAGKMQGYTFNRQRPVLRYIADFLCKPLNLIIEVDGSIHDKMENRKHDAFRQQELEACGYTVIRFRNEEVLDAIESVRKKIERTIKEIEPSALLTGRRRVAADQESD